ncbi:MAG: oxidoreductase, partial [Gemmatimonadaceae bacterium]
MTCKFAVLRAPFERRRWKKRGLFVAVQLAMTSSLAAQWTAQASGTTVSLRGLSVVNAQVAWASGEHGTVVHTENGGGSWRVTTIPGAEKWDVRSVHARSARVAHVAATAGRIWRTIDGGRSWSLRYQAADTAVFLDAIDFWDDRHGIAIGDPIGGRFFVLLTDDGGESWHAAPPASRPVALTGEAAFAASGSSLVVGRGDSVFLGSGGGAARVHVSGNRGRTWEAMPTPILQGGNGSRGIFSVSAPSMGSVVVVGGDYAQMDTVRDNAAYSKDRRTFVRGGEQPPRGFRSGVALFVRGKRPAVAIAVGPGGSDISMNHGGQWAAFDSVGFHAVRASRDGIFYASGSGGRLAKF